MNKLKYYYEKDEFKLIQGDSLEILNKITGAVLIILGIAGIVSAVI